MNRTLTAAATALVLVAGLSACKHHDGAEKREAAIKAVTADIEQLAKDYNAKDAAKSASHDASDYVGLYAGTPNAVGPKADEAMMAAQMKDPALHMELTGTPVTTASQRGDMVVYETGYAFTSTGKDGKPATEKGSWVAIYRQQEGGAMKLWRSILSAGPAEAAH